MAAGVTCKSRIQDQDETYDCGKPGLRGSSRCGDHIDSAILRMTTRNGKLRADIAKMQAELAENETELAILHKVVDWRDRRRRSA